MFTILIELEEIFSSSQLKIFHYDDIKNNPGKFMIDFYECINVKKESLFFIKEYNYKVWCDSIKKQKLFCKNT